LPWWQKGLATTHIPAPQGSVSETLTTRNHSEADSKFPQEDPGLKHPEQIFPQSVLQREAPSIATQSSISTLRRGREKKAPVRKVSTWIRNQRKEPRALIELRENPLLSITRKKFGQ
jgi:hypothetical protein